MLDKLKIQLNKTQSEHEMATKMIDAYLLNPDWQSSTEKKCLNSINIIYLTCKNKTDHCNAEIYYRTGKKYQIQL